MATASKSFSKSRNVVDKLMWPANLTDAFDYLQIDIVRFIPIAEAVSVTASNTTNPSTPVSPGQIIGPAAGFNIGNNSINGGLSNVQTSIQQEPLKTVLLPVPENLNYNDALKWSEEEIGVKNKTLPLIGAGLISGDAGDAAGGLQKMAQGGRIGVILDALKQMQFQANAVTQGMAGKIANPYAEQIFQGIGMRNFDLSWKLVPRSQSEQIKIHEMIKEIRKHALPNYSGSFGSSDSEGQLEDRWLEVPHIFKLSWKKPKGGELTSLPKIKPCVLKSVQVSYTPDNVWATHMVDRSDPYPVAYNISLSFSETEIITGKDVEKGY